MKDYEDFSGDAELDDINSPESTSAAAKARQEKRRIKQRLDDIKEQRELKRMLGNGYDE